jgi:hypothetical protein
VNFRRLLDANSQKMPFAAAQIGLGFRNGECMFAKDISFCCANVCKCIVIL